MHYIRLKLSEMDSLWVDTEKDENLKIHEYQVLIEIKEEENIYEHYFRGTLEDIKEKLEAYLKSIHRDKVYMHYYMELINEKKNRNVCWADPDADHKFDSSNGDTNG